MEAARRRAAESHLVVVNHALLMADASQATRGGGERAVLPAFEYLVVDEAHHLEEATTNALSFEVTQADIERTMRELGGPNSATLGKLLTTLIDVLTPADYAIFHQMAHRAADLAFHCTTSPALF